MKLTSKSGLILVLSLSFMLVGVSAVIYGSEQVNEDKQAPKTQGELLARTAEILAVEEGELLDALGQAYMELTTERLDTLVEEGWLGEKRAELMKERLAELSATQKARTLRFFICDRDRGPGGGRLGRRVPGVLPGRPERRGN